MTSILASIGGMLLILLLALALSTGRRNIRLRVVGAAFALQAGIAVLVLYVPAGKNVIAAMAGGVSNLLGYASAGTNFIFGPLASPDMGGNSFAIAALPVIIFFSALISILYYLNIMQFIIKCISRTELQMFLDCSPAYFEYLSKAFFHGLPTVLCKIVGVYQIGYHNRLTGKRSMEQVAVMQNIFFGRNISKIFDLKGSLRGRFTRQGNLDKEKSSGKGKQGRKSKSQHRRSRSPDYSDSDSESSDDDDEESLSTSGSENEKESIRSQPREASTDDKSTSIPTLLDGDFLEFTGGRPLPLTDRAKAVFHMSILNDTLFLSIINVLDYSILVGIDEERMELVVGIIDFMRQYDILKQMERVGKSLPMVVGSEAPTIIQPPLYKSRFTNAMERYFMTVPSKWTTI